jgi:uncharacterized membrane protein YdjX (TVP38/TMEM64 family)
MPDTAAILPAAAAPPAGVLFHLGPLVVTSRLLVRALAVAALVVALGLLWRQVDVNGLHARAKALPAFAVIAAIALLPVVGFPVSVLHLVAGVSFDFWVGILVVALTGVLHAVLAWALVRVLPRRFFQRLDPWREKLRGAGHRDATLLCCLLPGVPYTVQIYLLPVLGTPSRLMFVLSPVLHTVRAVVTILLGDMGDDLTPSRIAAVAAYYVVLFAVSAFALHHLRRSLNARPSSLSINSL